VEAQPINAQSESWTDRFSVKVERHYQLLENDLISSSGLPLRALTLSSSKPYHNISALLWPIVQVDGRNLIVTRIDREELWGQELVLRAHRPGIVLFIV
jgi:hypothetical protein